MFFFLNIRTNFIYVHSTFINSKVLLKYYFNPLSLFELIFVLRNISTIHKIYWIGMDVFALFSNVYFYNFFICTSELFRKIELFSYNNNGVLLKVGGYVDYFYFFRFCFKNDIDINKFIFFYNNTLNESMFFNKFLFLKCFEFLLGVNVISCSGKIIFYSFLDIIYYKKNFFNNSMYIISFIFKIIKYINIRNIFLQKVVVFNNGYKFLNLSKKNYYVYKYNLFIPSNDMFFFLNQYLKFSKNNINSIIIIKFITFSNIKLFLSYISYIIRKKYNIILLYKSF